MFLDLWALCSTTLLLLSVSARSVRRVKASSAPFQGWLVPPGHPFLLEQIHVNKLLCHVPPEIDRGHSHSTIIHFDSSRDYIGWRLQRRGVFEPQYTWFSIMVYHTFFPNFTKEKDPSKRPIYLDVGGNIGVYTVCALRNGLATITIEANPLTAGLLVTNVARELSYHHGGIGAVWNVGLGHENSDTPLCFVQNAENLGGSRFNSTAGECTMKLPIRDLPTVLGWASSAWGVGLSRLFYMKMDIELMEEKVLGGSGRFLRKGSPNRPCMGQMEVLRGDRASNLSIVDNSLKILRGHGYCIFVAKAIINRVTKHGFAYLQSEVGRPACHLDIPPLKSGRNEMDVVFTLMGEDFRECAARVATGVVAKGGGLSASTPTTAPPSAQPPAPQPRVLKPTEGVQADQKCRESGRWEVVGFWVLVGVLALCLSCWFAVWSGRLGPKPTGVAQVAP